MRLDQSFPLGQRVKPRENESFEIYPYSQCAPKSFVRPFGAVAMARRPHPYPSRTRSLSSSAPMVLRGHTAWESRTLPPHPLYKNPLGPQKDPRGFLFLFAGCRVGTVFPLVESPSMTALGVSCKNFSLLSGTRHTPGIPSRSSRISAIPVSNRKKDVESHWMHVISFGEDGTRRGKRRDVS